MLFNSKKDISNSTVTANETISIETSEFDKKEKSDNKWTWIEGYKGFNKDLCCHDFQYEIGKTYTMDEKDVEMCASGFHLCRNLEPIFSYYYPLNGTNRFCRVKALAKADDSLYASIYYAERDKKYVAKEITIIEELKPEDIIKILKTEKSYEYLINYYNLGEKCADLIEAGYGIKTANWIVSENLVDAALMLKENNYNTDCAINILINNFPHNRK